MINYDFKNKPWNESNEFDIHMRALTAWPSSAISLWYHLEDLVSFLQKYKHVIPTNFHAQ